MTLKHKFWFDDGLDRQPTPTPKSPPRPPTALVLLTITTIIVLIVANS